MFSKNLNKLAEEINTEMTQQELGNVKKVSDELITVNSGAEEKVSLRSQICDSLIGQVLFSLFMWWIVATVIYYNMGFSISDAIYYSLQAGYSIGFGSLDENKVTGKNIFDECASSNESDLNDLNLLVQSLQQTHGNTGRLCAYQIDENYLRDLSKAWTILHVCIGSSVIAGMLSLFAAKAIESSTSWADDMVEHNNKRKATTCREKIVS